MLAVVVNNTTPDIADGAVQFEVVGTNAGTPSCVAAVRMGATTTVQFKMRVHTEGAAVWAPIAAGITATGTVSLPGAGVYCVNITRSAGTDRADVTIHGPARPYPPSNVV